MSEGSRRAGRPRLPTPYLLLIPSALTLALLFGWPTVQGVLAAFRHDGGFSLDNVQRMVTDQRFGAAVRNTVLLIVVVVPLQFVLALAMALLIQARPRFAGLYFYLWAVPLAISDLAAGLVWLSIFDDQGYLNSMLRTLGLGDGYSWLSYQHTPTMFLAVVIAELWRATALVLVILVAGMQVIPRDYDEAAAVFGATFWQRLRYVTLPLLKPSLQVALILRTILAFQTFAVARALTGDNYPLLVGETYQWYLDLQNPGVASAIALLVLGISIFTAVIYLRALRQPDAVREAR
jgi:multiple sugar transport system permease protein